MKTIANLQKQDLSAAYLYTHAAFDPQYAQTLGVDLNKLLVFDTSSIDAVAVCKALLESRQLDLLVIDSIAGLSSFDSALNSDDSYSAFLTKMLRQLVPLLSKSNTCMLCTNQTRMKEQLDTWIETTPSSKALRYYTAIRLCLSRRGTIKKDDYIVGLKSTLTIERNRFAPLHNPIDFDLFLSSN